MSGRVLFCWGVQGWAEDARRPRAVCGQREGVSFACVLSLF